jgi:hypothetical protein
MKKLSKLTLAFGLLAIGALGVRLLAGEAADEQPAAEFGGVKPRIIGSEDDASGDHAVLLLEGPDVAQAHRKQAQAMLDAAKAAYKTTQTDYDAGTAVFWQVYDWSRWWLEAELNLAKDRPAEIAVLQDHWKRMKRYHFRIKALNKTGTRGGETQKLHAVEFYVAEAEFWLAAAGGAVPKKLDD